MNLQDNNSQAFLALVRAGLWETEARLSQYKDIDYSAILQLAEEQSVVGLVTAGLECVVDVKVPQEWVLQFIGETLQIEQQNKEMNSFISRLTEEMREAGINALLVKGQGVAQCYERPLWRASGDVDLLLDEDNFIKAQSFLLTKATSHEPELKEEKHQEFVVDSWIVEIHGNLPSHFSKKVDVILSIIQDNVFKKRQIREWKNGDVTINIPSANNDILFIFPHLLKHFFRGGVGLRQICDWCRLIWTYHKEIDYQLLENCLREMGLMTEWNAFAALAVLQLGYPEEKMPFYSNKNVWRCKASKILDFVLITGNFGHSRDLSYYTKYPYVVGKFISLKWRLGDNLRYLTIFPMDSLRVFAWLMRHGLKNL